MRPIRELNNFIPKEKYFLLIFKLESLSRMKKCLLNPSIQASNGYLPVEDQNKVDRINNFNNKYPQSKWCNNCCSLLLTLY